MGNQKHKRPQKENEFSWLCIVCDEKRQEVRIKSNISEKAKKTMKTKLKEQLKVIQHDTSPNQVSQLNAMILAYP